MKSQLTIDIENALIRKFKGTSYRYATEVSINNGKEYGVVDFITSKQSNDVMYGIPLFDCYEIKISYEDFLSKNGHNLYGDKNYYVMPDELFQYLLNKHADKLGHSAGIYVYKNKKLYLKRESSNRHASWHLTIEQRFRTLDCMIMQWMNNRVFIKE